MNEPPYLRIAADIRAQIASGELRPGDPVPSTRQITRRWKVAMATATKALAVLRNDGLIDVMRGVGAVVARPPASGRRPPRPPAASGGPTSPLTRERLVSAAIAVADTEGIGAVTMRRLAAELGTGPMALYRYVSGKEHLVQLMIDAAFATAPPPDPAPPGWRAKLTALARIQWRLCRRHPWLAGLTASVTRPPLAPHAMAHTEWALGALEGLGLDAATRLWVVMTSAGYVIGMAQQWAAETDATADTGLTHDQWMARHGGNLEKIFASGRYPRLASLAHDGAMDSVLDLDGLFEFGLRLHLDGVAALVARQGRPRQ